jgi:hypothetical protein
MGLGDVLRALRDPAGPFRVAESFQCDGIGDERGMVRSDFVDWADCWIDENSHTLDIVGGRPRILLSFWKRQLSGVTLFFDGGVDFRTHTARHIALLGILREKYGSPDVYPSGYRNPRERPEEPSTGIFTWELPKVRVELVSTFGGLNPRKNTRNECSVIYDDPRATRALNEHGRSRRYEGEREKL